MTTARPAQPVENVLGGALLALLAIPLGVVLLVLIASIGFVASIVGFVVAFVALWLYTRGSGGRISRTGAWAVTAIVLVTLLVGIWAVEVVNFAHGIGHLDNLNQPGFWEQFNAELPANLSSNALFIVLILAFGILGSIRLLLRAFRTTRVAPGPNASVAPTAAEGTITPTSYRNDVDAAPTGSADEKTPPPAVGS